MSTPRSPLETARPVYLALSILFAGLGLALVGLQSARSLDDPPPGAVGATCPLPSVRLAAGDGGDAIPSEPASSAGELSSSHLETAVFAVG